MMSPRHSPARVPVLLAALLLAAAPAPVLALRPTGLEETPASRQQLLHALAADQRLSTQEHATTGLEERRATDEIRASLGRLILAARAIDPEQPDATTLAALEHDLQLFRDRAFTITAPPSGFYTLSPLKYRSLSIVLAPNQTYGVEPYWEEGLGVRLYFSRPGAVERFGADGYRDVQPGTTLNTIYANRITTATTLVAARADPQDWLEALIHRAWRINAQQPDPDALHRFETQLAAFRDRQFTVTPSPGGSYSIAPERRNQMQFMGLNPAFTYRLAPYWEDGLGLRIYFTHPEETLRHAVFRKAPGSPSKLTLLIARTRDLAEARRHPDEWLRMFILNALPLDPNAPDPKALRQLRKRLALFHQRRFTLTCENATGYQLNLTRGQSLLFGAMRADEHDGVTVGHPYRIVPMWERGLGLRIYLERPREVLRYAVGQSVWSNRRGRSRVAYADLRTITPTLAMARADLKDWFGTLVTHAIALTDETSDPAAWHRLEAQISAFRKRRFAVQIPEDGTYHVTYARNQRVQFRSLTPHAAYAIQPFLDRDRGFHVYFLGTDDVRWKVRGYTLAGAPTYRGSDGRLTTHATMIVRAPDLATAQHRLLVVDHAHRSATRATVLPAALMSDQFADVVEATASATNDTAGDVATRELQRQITTVLQTHHYTNEQIQRLVGLGELVFCGLPMDQALTESDVPADQHAWYLIQWTEVLPGLLSHLRDDEPKRPSSGLEEARPSTREAVRTLGGQVSELLELGHRDALLALGPNAVEPLIEIFRTHRQWMFRVAAAQLLGRLGDARAVKPLYAVATTILSKPLSSREESDGEILEAALEALSHIHDPRATGDLLRILQRDSTDYPVREAALKAAAGITQPAVGPLVTAFMAPDLSGTLDEDACLLLGTTSEAWMLNSVPPDQLDRDGFSSVIPLRTRWLQQAFNVSPAALHAFFTFFPASITNLPSPAIVQDATRRLAWLPPVGEKLLTDAEGSAPPDSPNKPSRLPPSWTAEEQAAAIVQLQRHGSLTHGFIRQMTVQGQLPDAFKDVAIALILASPYGHDWRHPFFRAVWGRIAPLIHDGGQFVGDLNPLWHTVEGRTDFLLQLASAPEEGAEVVEARLFRESKAYQRLALACHCAQGTAPEAIPESVRVQLASHWHAFVNQMDQLLGEFEIRGVAQVPWFLEKPRRRQNWPGPRYEAPWPPIREALLTLETKRRDPEYARALRLEAERILEEFTTAIDHDLGLLGDAQVATGLEESPAIAFPLEPALRERHAQDTLGVEA